MDREAEAQEFGPCWHLACRVLTNNLTEVSHQLPPRLERTYWCPITIAPSEPSLIFTRLRVLKNEEPGGCKGLTSAIKALVGPNPHLSRHSVPLRFVQGEARRLVEQGFREAEEPELQLLMWSGGQS